MHADLCDGVPGLCDAMKPTKGMELLKYLRKVEFQGSFISSYYDSHKICTTIHHNIIFHFSLRANWR